MDKKIRKKILNDMRKELEKQLVSGKTIGKITQATSNWLDSNNISEVKVSVERYSVIELINLAAELFKEPQIAFYEKDTIPMPDSPNCCYTLKSWFAIYKDGELKIFIV